MGYKLYTEKDRERLEKKRLKEVKREKRRAIEKLIIHTLISPTAIVFYVCLIIFGTAFIAKQEKIRTKAVYDGVVDWNKMVVPKEDYDMTSLKSIDGLIGFDAFYEYEKTEKFQQLQNMKALLSDDIYENMLQGMNSQYFYDSVQADYKDLITSMDDLLRQSQWINALYKTYNTQAEVSEASTDGKCLIPEDGKEYCLLKQLAVDFTSGELQKYLLDTHDKWETLVNYRKDLITVTDKYINAAYQEKICTDVTTISKLDIEVEEVGHQLYKQGPDAVKRAIKNKKIKSLSLTETTPEAALKQLDLYYDPGFYTGDFATLAADTALAVMSNDIIEHEQYLGDNLTTDEVINKLKNGEFETPENSKVINATPSDVDSEDLDEYGFKNGTIDGYQCLATSLTGRDENDKFYVFFKINDCEHDLSLIRTYDSWKSDLEKQSEIVEAQKEIADIITAEIEDLDINSEEDIKKYFSDFGEPINLNDYNENGDKMVETAPAESTEKTE